MWSKAKPWIEKNEFIIILLLLTIALRIPSLFEPYWYGDEAIYLTIGQALRRGFVLYKDIHDNKPPLLYITAALAGGSQFWFKLLSLISNLASVFIFWKISIKLWAKDNWAVWSTLLFVALLTLPLLEGNIANAENFFILPTLAAFYLILKTKNNRILALGGVLYGIAALYKMPAVLDVLIWPICWFVTKEKNWFSKSLSLGLGVMSVLLASVAFYYLDGSLNSYLVAAGLQNVPYLSSWQSVPGFIGQLKGRALILAVLIASITGLKNKIGKPLLLVALWWAITFFSALLSGRPYPHYLLQMLPAACLGIFYLAENKKYNRLVISALILFTIFGITLFRFYRYPVLGYYLNFFEWSVGQKSTQEYYSWFNKSVNRNYKIAQTIISGSHVEEKIFVWGDEPMIYALSRRTPAGKYTAKYHINDFRAHNETIDALKLYGPRYIITFSNQTELPYLKEILDDSYILETTVDDAQIYRRILSLARYN